MLLVNMDAGFLLHFEKWNCPGEIIYTILRFFTNFPIGIMTVLFAAMFSDVIDDIEMKTAKGLRVQCSPSEAF